MTQKILDDLSASLAVNTRNDEKREAAGHRGEVVMWVCCWQPDFYFLKEWNLPLPATQRDAAVRISLQLHIQDWYLDSSMQ